jgi:hypothetical protein
MNVFVLDETPILSAQYHTNTHCIKMILESAQILSTACYVNNIKSNSLYKPTHINHPCVIKASKSRENYLWVLELMECLCNEYKFRYNKTHKSSRLIDELKSYSTYIPSSGNLEFAQAMPEEYKKNNVVEAYREYYYLCKMTNKNGRPTDSWNFREKPFWLVDKQKKDHII